MELITGWGMHSEGRGPVLRPAVLKYLADHNIPARVHPTNQGVVLADLKPEAQE